MKEDPPFKYNGEVQVSTFKRWCREIRSWVQRGCLSEQAGIEMSGKYLGGRAYLFFERGVLAVKKPFLSLAGYFKHLFDYLFPLDFRMQQRDKFDLFEQRELSVLDFLRRLHELADTIGDLDDRDIIIAFWRRCKPYLRFEMLREGLDPSIMSLITLEEAAVRQERAHSAAEEDSKRSKRGLGMRETGPGKGNKTPARNQASVSTTPSNGSQPAPQAGTSRRPNQQNSGQRSDQGPRIPKRDAERTKRLRSEGKCFHCESRDHLMKDCPERNNKRPPLSLRSMELTSPVEVRLAAMQEGHELGLFGVGPVGTHDFPEIERVGLDDIRHEIRERLIKILYEAAPLAFDYEQPDAQNSPFMPDRFKAFDESCCTSPDSVCGLGCLLLYDNHSSTEYEVTYDELLLPQFDIIGWLHTEKSKRFDELLRGRRDRKWTGPKVPFIVEEDNGSDNSIDREYFRDDGTFEYPEYGVQTDPGEWDERYSEGWYSDDYDSGTYTICLATQGKLPCFGSPTPDCNDKVERATVSGIDRHWFSWRFRIYNYC